MLLYQIHWNFCIRILTFSKDKEERFEVFDHARRNEVRVALMNETKIAESLQTSLSVKSTQNLLVVTINRVPSVNHFFMSDSE